MSSYNDVYQTLVILKKEKTLGSPKNGHYWRQPNVSLQKILAALSNKFPVSRFAICNCVEKLFTRKQYSSSQMARFNPKTNPIENVWGKDQKTVGFGSAKNSRRSHPKSSRHLIVCPKITHKILPLVFLVVDFKMWLKDVATNFQRKFLLGELSILCLFLF